MRSRTIESNSPSGRAATQPRRSQGASKARAVSRIAPVAVGGQPLLGGEGVEALADDLKRAVGVAHRGQIAGGRDDHVIARPVRRADDPDERERNGARAGTVQVRQIVALITASARNGSA